MTTSPLTARGRSTAAARGVIVADYQQAFGLPSPLHHHTLLDMVSEFGIARLRSLLTGRGRH